jgi:hypothetical protein
MAVTGQLLKSEVLILAEKIVELCREHTSSKVEAIAATEIAGKAIFCSLDAESPNECTVGSD